MLSQLVITAGWGLGLNLLGDKAVGLPQAEGLELKFLPKARIIYRLHAQQNNELKKYPFMSSRSQQGHTVCFGLGLGGEKYPLRICSHCLSLAGVWF